MYAIALAFCIRYGTVRLRVEVMKLCAMKRWPAGLFRRMHTLTLFTVGLLWSLMVTLMVTNLPRPLRDVCGDLMHARVGCEMHGMVWYCMGDGCSQDTWVQGSRRCCCVVSSHVMLLY